MIQDEVRNKAKNFLQKQLNAKGQEKEWGFELSDPHRDTRHPSEWNVQVRLLSLDGGAFDTEPIIVIVEELTGNVYFYERTY
ncbi:hypothetical protein [Planctomicrobium sp. SH664]|uniref:hypothetical protein n=1 Tax=Planctomicrobium sp. SH664 TaxID=3448125 RepID=UPI003F5B6831